MKFLRLLPIALAFAATPLAATTVVGTGTPASCTEAALNAAITEANATFGLVTFNCGAAPLTLVVTTEKPLALGVVIDGGNKITLSGGNTTRIFSLYQGAAVEIRNIVLTRGLASEGGGCVLAISSTEANATLVIDHVTFKECRATVYGGALAGFRADFTISNSLFIDNQAISNGGGAISLNSGSLGLSHTTFETNTAGLQGGALQSWYSAVTVDTSVFYANRAGSVAGVESGGGGVLLRAGTATFRNSDFSFNVSETRGGGFFLFDGADADLEDLRISLNAAVTGAGLLVDPTSVARVKRSSFVENQASDDGGALFSSGALHVAASTLYYNLADDGPGIFTDGGLLDLVSSTLVDNQGWASPPATGQLAWLPGPSLNVHNTLFQSTGTTFVPACDGMGGSFTFSMWQGISCNAAGLGNSPLTTVPLRPYGLSCGSSATELTRSFALPPGSPALDAGSCRISDPSFDQRGNPRPQGVSCDIGATEFFAPCDAPFFANGFEQGTTAAWSVTVP